MKPALIPVSFGQHVAASCTKVLKQLNFWSWDDCTYTSFDAAFRLLTEQGCLSLMKKEKDILLILSGILSLLFLCHFELLFKELPNNFDFEHGFSLQSLLLCYFNSFPSVCRVNESLFVTKTLMTHHCPFHYVVTVFTEQ